MNSPEVKAFIRKQSDLFWYIPDDKKEDISPDILVEFILNYGDMKAVKELFSILGIQKVSDLFFSSLNLSERRKGNFSELTINFFTLYFDRNAHRNTN